MAAWATTETEAPGNQRKPTCSVLIPAGAAASGGADTARPATAGRVAMRVADRRSNVAPDRAY
jgi:hypothetical protein